MNTPIAISKPTKKSENTLVFALIALVSLSIIFALILMFGSWNEAVADRVHFLGWGLLLSVGGIILLVLGFISPWVGSVKASGMGATLQLNGDGVVTTPAEPAVETPPVQ